MVGFEVSYMTRIEVRIRHISETKCLLGEGVDLHYPTGKLAWVDIEFGRVFVSDLQLSKEEIYENLEFPSKIFFDENGALFVLHQQGISRFCSEKKAFELEFQWPFEMDNLRFNDAARIDDKTYCVSTLSTKGECDVGEVWLWNIHRKPIRLVSNLSIPNSIVYDRLLDRLYFCDSKTGVISFLHLKANHSYLDFCHFSEVRIGVPDGSTIDEFGNLWNCRWEGGCILIFNTNGNQVKRIELPTRRPTSCKLSSISNSLIVTSASADGSSIDGHTIVYEIVNSK